MAKVSWGPQGHEHWWVPKALVLEVCWRPRWGWLLRTICLPGLRSYADMGEENLFHEMMVVTGGG